ncbi:hypothetical protein KJ975_08780 [Myxococcota bacterium]|nr:hypothetical protein [Myxococcota bacterium]
MRTRTYLFFSFILLFGVLGCDEDKKAETCTVLAERFDADTVVPAGCYLAQKTPVLAAGVKLTLDPGVKIIFSAGTKLEISGDQVLDAVGTAGNPILLTGEVQQRGHWVGLRFDGTADVESRLAYVTVEYAGNTTSDSDSAGIKATADSRGVTLSMTHTTARENQGWGLFLTGSALMPAFSDNTLTLNTLGPANVDSEVAGLLDASSSYAGNDVDEVWVRTYSLSKNGTWHAIDVPFHLSGNLRVELPWTIEAGNTLILEEDAHLVTNGDDAALYAIGTAQAPILFTGAQKVRGFWWSLDIGSSDHADNRLDHVTFEYGGSIAHDANGACLRLVADSRGVTMNITNAVFRECAGYGLNLTGSAVLPEFSDNTLTLNTLGPVMSGSTAVHQLDTTSTYTGNDVDEVRVDADWVDQSVTWEDLGVPYNLDNHIDVNGTEANPVVWTLAPGVTLILPAAGILSVPGDYSGFHAVGTAEKPITITGAEKTSGFWKAIVFDTTLNAANAIDHAIIEYGGSVGGSGEEAMIHIASDSHGVSVNITNSTLTDSGLYAIYLGLYAQVNADIETSNTFSGNASGDVFRDQ